jgi:VRR-NUC domain
MTPEQIAEAGTEHAHQTALCAWRNSVLPQWPILEWMYAIPNGGNRNVVTAVNLKMEGVKAGISDLCLPFSRRGYHGFYIEMKKPKGKESKEQKDFGQHLMDNGYLYTCCDHWEKARDAIIWYMTNE